ncbi:unnamed protein product, partial [Heterosigma akashiwo]
PPLPLPLHHIQHTQLKLGRMGCTSSKEASRLKSGAASSAAASLSAQEDARVAANPVAQANKGTTTSVQ